MRKLNGQSAKGDCWREARPWWNREWLHEQYRVLKRSAKEIAVKGGVGETAILYWLAKHSIPRWSISEIRKRKYWGSSGEDNPMFGRFGALNPHWRGGITADRQAFYAGRGWKAACSAVWERDEATCQRCGTRRGDVPDLPFHIHHIIPFANEEMRAVVSNLVLLCKCCHDFVHSKQNVQREYLPQE